MLRTLLLTTLLLTLAPACSSTEGGSLEVRVREASFEPLLATELGRLDDLGDVVFNLDQAEAPDDSFGFTVSWAGEDGTYVMQSGAGDPETFAGQRILVVGGTGRTGARLVERLRGDPGCAVAVLATLAPVVVAAGPSARRPLR